MPPRKPRKRAYAPAPPALPEYALGSYQQDLELLNFEYRPWFSYCAVALCCLQFGVEMRQARWIFLPLVCPQKCDGAPCGSDGAPCEANLLFGPSLSVLKLLGAKSGDAILVHGEWWRVFACNWLHAGVLHVMSNAMGILNLGVGLERVHGGIRVGIVYLWSGLAGTLLSLLFLPDVLTVGASGSVFGLIGAVWADLASRCLACQLCSVATTLLPLMVFTSLNLVIGFSPWVDNFVHLGGFVAGFVGALAAFDSPKPSQAAPPSLLGIPARLTAAASILLFLVFARAAATSAGTRSSLREACGSACELLNCAEPYFVGTNLVAPQPNANLALPPAAEASSLEPSSPLWTCCFATSPTQCSVTSTSAWVNVTCQPTSEPPNMHRCDPLGEAACDPAHIDALCQRFCFCTTGFYRVYLDRGFARWPRFEYHEPTAL